MHIFFKFWPLWGSVNAQPWLCKTKVTVECSSGVRYLSLSFGPAKDHMSYSTTLLVSRNYGVQSFVTSTRRTVVEERAWCMCAKWNTAVYCLLFFEWPTLILLNICFFLGATAPQWARVSSFTRFLDHTQRRTIVGRTPLDEWSVRRRDL